MHQLDVCLSEQLFWWLVNSGQSSTYEESHMSYTAQVKFKCKHNLTLNKIKTISFRPNDYVNSTEFIFNKEHNFINNLLERLTTKHMQKII